MQIAHSPLPHLRRWLGLAVVVAAASTLFAAPGKTAALAVEQSTPAAQVADIDVSTWWRPNGLRVVTITGPWPADMVSIRVLIAGGCATAAGADKYGFHFLEHLVFGRTGRGADPYTTEGEGGGKSHASISLDHQRHEYDVDVRHAKAILDGIISEWDRDAFTEVEVERERRRMDHELGSLLDEWPLSRLGSDIRPQGALSYSNKLERAFVDTVSAVTLRRIFNERYVAGRLTLVVAGSASTLSTLKGEIEELARIPAGARGPDLGDLSWLAGDVRTVANRVAGRYVGYRIPNPGDVPARMRYLIWSAVAKRSVEVFAEEWPDPVEPEVSTCQTPEEEVWVFDVVETADFSRGVPAVYRTFETCLEYLASPEASEWWRDVIERDTREYELLDDRPDTVADQVVWSLVGSAQESAAPSWTELAGPIDPFEAVEAARRLRERAVVFRVLPDARRLSMEREAQQHMAQSACTDVNTLEGDDAPAWSVVRVLATGMTVSAAFGLGLSAAIRALKRRFSRLRPRFVFPRKRGRDGA